MHLYSHSEMMICRHPRRERLLDRDDGRRRRRDSYDERVALRLSLLKHVKRNLVCCDDLVRASPFSLSRWSTRRTKPICTRNSLPSCHTNLAAPTDTLSRACGTTTGWWIWWSLGCWKVEHQSEADRVEVSEFKVETIA